MFFNYKYTQAKPLTAEIIQEFKDEGCEDLVVQLNGEFYNSEDIYYCENHENCGYKTTDYDNMHDGLCETCTKSHLEYEDYIEDVNWTYNHSRL